MSPPPRTPKGSTTARAKARAKRLEEIREDLELSSIRKFWEALVAGGVEVSYEAVRNYHYDRDAPVDYYLSVARLFQVNPLWLMDERGPKWIGEAALEETEPLDPVAQKLAVALASLEGFSERRNDYRQSFGWLLLELLRATRLDLEASPQEDLTMIAGALENLIRLPWIVLNARPSDPLEEEDVGDRRAVLAVLSMFSAVRAAIPADYGDSGQAALQRLVQLSEMIRQVEEPGG